MRTYEDEEAHIELWDRFEQACINLGKLEERITVERAAVAKREDYLLGQIATAERQLIKREAEQL